MKKLLACLTVLLLFMSCEITDQNVDGIIMNTTPIEEGKGRIVFNISWPESRAIPENTDALKLMVVPVGTNTEYKNEIIERGVETSETISFDMLPGNYEIYVIAVGNPIDLEYEIIGYGYIDDADYITIQKDVTTPANITIKPMADFMNVEYTTADPDNVQIGDTVTATVFMDTKMRPFELVYEEYNHGYNTIYYKHTESELDYTGYKNEITWTDSYYSFDFVLYVIETQVYGMFKLGTNLLYFDNSSYSTSAAFIRLDWDVYNISGEAVITIE